MFVCLVDSLLNCAPDFVVNWIEVMAVWQPLSWCDECVAVGFTSFSSCLWHFFKSFRPRSRLMRTNMEDWEKPISLNIWCVASHLDCVSAPPLQPHCLHCVFPLACNCHASVQYFMFIAAYTVMYLVFSLSSRPAYYTLWSIKKMFQ